MPEQSKLRESLKLILGTVSGSLFLLFGSLLLASAAVLFGWIGPRGHFVFWIAQTWGRGVLLFSGVRVRPDFDARIDRDGQYVFMANHRSLFDIPALLATLPVQTRFLAKKSLFQIPIFGWALKVGGFITIDRKDLSTARDSFSAAVEQLNEGASVLVFPEGTRSLGSEMLQFKRGGFLLALKSGLPIVPVGIVGSGEVQMRRKLTIRPGVIQLHYGAPIAVDGFGVGKRKELMDEVHRQISELCGTGLETSAPAPPGGVSG